MNHPACEPLVIWARARREETHRTAGRRQSPGRNGGTAPTLARAADELAASAVPKPLLVVITGLDKPFRTELSPADYAKVRVLGAEYVARNPRSIL